MENFNNNPSAERLNAIEAKTDCIIEMARDSLDKIYERGVTLSVL